MSEIARIQRDLTEGALLIDVRTPEEFAAEHALGAQNMSHQQIIDGAYPTPNKQTKIYLYCRSGARAGAALEAMRAAGYQNVINLGGLSRWKELGGRVQGVGTQTPQP